MPPDSYALLKTEVDSRDNYGGQARISPRALSLT